MKLFIGNLPYDTSEAELTALFKAYGEIVDTNLILNHFTGKSKGFAFVEMSDRSSGQQALESLNKMKYKNNILVCNEAQPKKKTKRRR